MSAIQTFRHYRISQDPSGGAVEVWRSGSEVVCVAVDTLRQVFVELHVGIADPSLTRELKPFQQLANQAGQIRHRHLLTILDSGEDEGANYYVTEFVDGERLDSYLARCNPLPTWLALLILTQLTEGLQSLSQQPALLANLNLFNSTIQLLGEGPPEIVCKIADLALTLEPEKSALSLAVSTQRIIRDSARLLYYMLTGKMPAEVPRTAEMAALAPELAFLLTALGQSAHAHHPAGLDQLANLVSRCQHDLPAESGGTRPPRLTASLQPRLPLQSHYLSPTTVAEAVSADYAVDAKPFDAAHPYRQAATLRSTRAAASVQLLPPDRLMARDYARNLRTAVQRLNALDHPNLLRVLTYPDSEAQEFYVEEATGKYHLASVLRLKGGFDVQDCTLVLEQLLEANRQAEGCGVTPVLRSLAHIHLHFTDPRGETELPAEATLASLPLADWPAFRLRVRTYPTALSLSQPERYQLERWLPAGHPGLDSSPTQKSSSLLTPLTARDCALFIAIFTAGNPDLSEKLRHHVLDHLRLRKGEHQPTPQDFVTRLAAMSGRLLVTQATPGKMPKKKPAHEELELQFETASAPSFFAPLHDPPPAEAYPAAPAGGFAEMLFGGQLPQHPDDDLGPVPTSMFGLPAEPEEPLIGHRNFLDGPDPDDPRLDPHAHYDEETEPKRSGTLALILLVVLVAGLVAGLMAHFTGRAFWLHQ